MVTPFHEDGRVDEPSAIRISEFMLEKGMVIFLLGTTGEALSMPLEMRVRFVQRIMKEVSPRNTVFIGISDHVIDNSIEAAKRYHDSGADVFVAHLPSYYPLTPDAMLAYYERLAERIPGPVMLYNVPGTTKLSIPVDVVEKLSHHPNIIGLKDSERDLDRLGSLIEMFGDREDFVLMCGWTVESTRTLLMGFDGIVPSTANVIPDRFYELYQAARQGDVKRSMELQAVVNPVAELHQKNRSVSWAISGLKVMMNEMNLCAPWVRPPLIRLGRDEEAELRDAFRKLSGS
jgi:4-hydroxy-tetrahydrodipicolinate synthase